jgi:hypothetical protein
LRGRRGARGGWRSLDGTEISITWLEDLSVKPKQLVRRGHQNLIIQRAMRYARCRQRIENMPMVEEYGEERRLVADNC